MQQYFVSYKLEINKTISLDEDIVFHLTKVLRNSEKEFRLVDINGDIFFSIPMESGGALLVLRMWMRKPEFR